MTFALRDAASRYLRGESLPWLAFFRLYSKVWFERLAAMVNAETEEVRFSGLADEMYSLFLRPDFARDISRAESDETASVMVHTRCQKLLAQSSLVAVARQGEHSSPIYPFFDKVAIVDENEEYVGIDSEFTIPLKSVKLRDIIDVSIISADVGDERGSLFGHDQTLVRLDVIDHALYKTLLAQPDLLKTLHWRTFEELLADILKSFGYEIELQRGTKDGGIDIFALKRDGDFGQHRYLVQAKRWSNRVGVEPVQQLMFLHNYHRITKSCLATTATFTKGAWQLAEQYRWQLELRDFQGIQEWLAQAGQKRFPKGTTRIYSGRQDG